MSCYAPDNSGWDPSVSCGEIPMAVYAAPDEFPLMKVEEVLCFDEADSFFEAE